MTLWTVIAYPLLLSWLLRPPTKAPDYYTLAAEVFFAQPRVQAPMNLVRPDTVLLDAALFHATNEARKRFFRPLLQPHHVLQHAAADYAQAMIDKEFYGHQHPYSPLERTAKQRIETRGGGFDCTAENIAYYTALDAPDYFYVRYNRQQQHFEYLNPASMAPLLPYSYADFARLAVQRWLDSPYHRESLLNTAYTHVGCAVRLSHRAYQVRKAPYAKLVQKFGGN